MSDSWRVGGGVSQQNADKWPGRHLDKAERDIQIAMLRLEDQIEGTGYRIDCVRVDTKNLTKMRTVIMVSKIGD